jgi:mono/diheme cytochrome c family protein
MSELLKNRGKGNRMRRSTRLLLIAGTALVAVILPLSVGAQEDVDGRDVYLAQCSGCHQDTGLGIAGSFPPLAGNDRVGDTEYVKSVILEGVSGPIEVLGVGYDGVMPAFSLGDAEVDALIEFLQTEFAPVDTGDAPADTGETPAEPVSEETGDPPRGKELFSGAARLENGGPACASCHTAADYQALNGPAWGPDLTDLAGRYGGGAAVATALVNPPSVTMQPIFADSPISDQERADLGAYFESISDVEPGGGIDVLLLGGLLGAAVLFTVMWVMPRSPRTGFARQLRSQR